MSLLTVPSTVMLVGPRRMREAIAFGVDIPTWNAKVTQGRADRLEGSRRPIREDSTVLKN